jgi:hypothetical protein
MVPPTSRVDTVKVALDAPAVTVTLAGTDSGSFAESAMTAPPTGAGALRLAVPVTDVPPTTLALLNEIPERAARATVKVDD